MRSGRRAWCTGTGVGEGAADRDVEQYRLAAVYSGGPGGLPDPGLAEAEELPAVQVPAKMPRPVSSRQAPVLTLASAGPVKLSARTCFHGGAEGSGAGPVADEQPTMVRTGRTLIQAASRRSRREERVRSALPPLACPLGTGKS